MKTWLKGKAAETIMDLVKNKVDMFNEGLKLNELLDKQLGKKSSEKIQRGVISDMLIELLKGLWNENPDSLAAQLELEAAKIRKEL